MRFARYFSLILVIALLFTGLPAHAQQTGCRTLHTVQRGEDLYRIGLLYNLTWDQIAAANSLVNANYIQAGMVLCIPFGTGGPVVTPPSTGQVTGQCRANHTVRRGEDLRSIGQIYNTDWNILAAANNISNPNYIQVGWVLCIPRTSATGGPTTPTTSQCRVNHTVRRGEDLRSIGRFYGLTWDQIAAANNLANPNYIQVGWILCIPRTTATGGPTGQTPSTGQVITGQCRLFHTVQRGENLFRIGLLYGLTWDQLLSSNRITNPNYIPAGTTICIPLNPPAPQFGTGGPIRPNPNTGPVFTGSPFVRVITVNFNRQNNQITVSSAGFPPNSRFDVYIAAIPTDFSRGILFSSNTDANGNLTATFTASNLTTAPTQYVTVVGSEGFWGRSAFAR